MGYPRGARAGTSMGSWKKRIVYYLASRSLCVYRVEALTRQKTLLNYAFMHEDFDS